MQILEGIRIISMAEQYPGPYCTLLLADMGADVLLVERPNGGDPARQAPHFFGAINRNKRSMTLNLKDDRGMAVCRKLVENADVFLEGFRPGVAARLGLGYEVLNEVNPKLIYCSISGYGQDSPYRDRPGHDLSYAALAGMFSNLIASGNFDGRPDVAIGDLSSGMFAALGILGALFARERTGLGQYLDVSMTDGLVSWMTARLVPFLAGQVGFDPDPSYGVFRCADGKYLTLSIAHEDHFWQPLCRVLGWEDLAGYRAFERRAHGQTIRQRLTEAFAAKPRDYWVETLAAADVASGPLLDLEEVVNHPHVVKRGILQQIKENDGRLTWHVAQPVKFSQMPTEIRRPAPVLGEHNEEVLRSLGFGEDEIAALQREKVC